MPSLSRPNIQFSNCLPVATAKHARRPETAATSVWETKELRLLYPPTRLHGVKIQKNAKWTLKQGNNAKTPGCCHRVKKKIFYYNFKEDHFIKDSARVDQHFSKEHSACCCGMPSVPMSTSNTKTHKHSHWSTLQAQSTAQSCLCSSVISVRFVNKSSMWKM